MFKKVNLPLTIILVIIFVNLINLTSANFVCGRVLSENNLSTSWMKVNVYFTDQPTKMTSCTVSPDGYKFCCDTDDIKGVSWAKGKSVTAEVFDNVTGLFANPANLKTTGEGYDVLSDLIVKDAITLNVPENLILFKSKNLTVNATIENPFNKLYFEDSQKNRSFVCENCSNFSIPINNLNLGENHLKFIVVDNRNRSIEKKINVFILDYLIINRTFECSGCKDNFVYSGAEEVNVSLTINASSPISGFIYDYFPDSWLFLYSEDNESETQAFSDTHDLVKWPINGSYIVKKYVLKPPTTYLVKSFIFHSAFENVHYDYDKVYVYRLFRLTLFSQEVVMNKSSLKDRHYFKVSNTEPIIVKPDSNYITQIAIFSNSPLYGAKALFKETEFKDSKIKFTSFFLDTNLNDQDVSTIMIDFKLNKSKITLTNDTFTLYVVEKPKQLKSINYSLELEDGDFYYFRSFTRDKGSFLITRNEK